MQLQSSQTDDLSSFIDNTEVHSWNRERTSEELRDFIELRHSQLTDVALFD
jgi:E3 ubiquitin-protein ligase DOA10